MNTIYVMAREMITAKKGNMSVWAGSHGRVTVRRMEMTS